MDTKADTRRNRINVCATNFTVSRPNQTIQNAMSRKLDKQNMPRKEIDLTQISSDESFEGEVIERGEPIWIDDEEIEFGQQEDAEAESGRQDYEVSEVDEIGRKRKLSNPTGQQPTLVTCKKCGSRLFPFSTAAHKAFHDGEIRQQKGTIKTKKEANVIPKRT